MYMPADDSGLQSSSRTKIAIMALKKLPLYWTVRREYFCDEKKLSVKVEASLGVSVS
jgi:hypothetical protein